MQAELADASALPDALAPVSAATITALESE
jgi:hypothetical protein